MTARMRHGRRAGARSPIVHPRGVVVIVEWLDPCIPRPISPLAYSSRIAVALALVGTGAPVWSDPKRAVPDYDGRGNPDADGGHWALWIPRVLLAPVYVAHEYLIRRPVGAFVTHAERAHWAES